MATEMTTQNDAVGLCPDCRHGRHERCVTTRCSDTRAAEGRCACEFVVKPTRSLQQRVVVRPVVAFIAECPCGWYQRHTTEANARWDGDEHAHGHTDGQYALVVLSAAGG